MAEAYSIRESLQGALLDFVQESAFENMHLQAMVRELVGLLASYREEDLPLFPEVYVCASPNGLKALAPSGEQVTIGTAKLTADSAPLIVKNCAPLACGGWSIFVIRDDEQVRYGLFRSVRHSLGTRAEEAMKGLGKDVPVIMIRNRGHLVVELRSTTGLKFTVALTTTPAKASPLEHDIEEFVLAAASALNDSDNYKSYLGKTLTDILQRCHGTLLAVIPRPIDSSQGAPFTGVWPDPCLDLAGLYSRAQEAGTADALADLQAAEALLRGMINSDGVVMFGDDGTVLAYRVFLKPEENELSRLSDLGGGRRRTYEVMKLRLNTTFKAAFFRSQDGETGCIRQG